MAATLRTLSYRPAGAGGYTVLADETAPALAAQKDVIEGALPQMTGQAQVEPLFNQPNMYVNDLGNRSWRWQITVTRTFANPEAAALFAATHPAALPGLMDLLLVQGNTLLYLVKAQLTGFNPGVPNGVTYVCTYQFTAQNFTTNPP